MQIDGEYLNLVSKNAFSKVLRFSNGINFSNRIRAVRFLPAFRQREESRLLNFRSVSMFMSRSFTLFSSYYDIFWFYKFFPRYVHAYRISSIKHLPSFKRPF